MRKINICALCLAIIGIFVGLLDGLFYNSLGISSVFSSTDAGFGFLLIGIPLILIGIILWIIGLFIVNLIPLHSFLPSFLLCQLWVDAK